MNDRWCLASHDVGDGTDELGCDRLEHQDGELHYDEKRQLFWLGGGEAADYEQINVTMLATM